MALFSVEIGIRQRKNLCRMRSSIVVTAETSADAVRYVEQHFPNTVANAEIQRVCEVEHVFVDWPTGTVCIAEAQPSEQIFF